MNRERVCMGCTSLWTAGRGTDCSEFCKKIKVEKFLDGLKWLTKKHGIVIGGCGCCGSPYLYDVDRGSIVGENLEYKEGDYVLERDEC